MPALLARRWSRFLDGLIEAPPPVGADLFDTVIPTLELPTLEDRAAAFVQVAGTVGDRSMVQLFNPADSGFVLELQFGFFEVETTMNIEFRMHDVALTGNSTSILLTNRTRGRVRDAAGQLRSLSGTEIGSFFATRSVASGSTTLLDFVPLGISLAQGRGFNLVPATDDVDFTCSLFWIERPIK